MKTVLVVLVVLIGLGLAWAVRLVLARSNTQVNRINQR